MGRERGGCIVIFSCGIFFLSVFLSPWNLGAARHLWFDIQKGRSRVCIMFTPWALKQGAGTHVSKHLAVMPELPQPYMLADQSSTHISLIL